MQVEVASTPDQLATGLMGRHHLPDDHGMLFDLKGGPAFFWMRNTTIPLDIAFLDGRGRVMSIQTMPAHTGVARQPGDVRWAVETNAGWMGRHNVKPGMEVEMDRIKTAAALTKLARKELTDAEAKLIGQTPVGYGRHALGSALFGLWSSPFMADGHRIRHALLTLVGAMGGKGAFRRLARPGAKGAHSASMLGRGVGGLLSAHVGIGRQRDALRRELQSRQK